MLTYLSSSIWASPAQTLVNTVNVVGAMGRGIALKSKGIKGKREQATLMKTCKRCFREFDESEVERGLNNYH